MTLAYIASPYGAIKKARPTLGSKEVRKEAVSIAFHASLLARAKGYAPVSPVILWDMVYDDNRPGDREKALAAGHVLMMACDVFMWADTKYSELSDGMKAEKEAAVKVGMRVEIIKL